ncbi:MAG: carotenoid biosynthesis protein [Anaerolineae bacterium]
MSFPPISHVLFELAVYALALGCLWHARRQGRVVVLTLLGAMVYGFLLELMGLTLKSSPKQSYDYGRFLIEFFANTKDALPLAIVAGWGIIFYATIQTTNMLGETPPWARSFINGTLALSLDFVMDPVASGPMGLKMWTWNSSTDTFWWMGVPSSNYVGWFTVLVSFSLYTLLGHRLVPPGSKGFWGDVGVMAAAIAASLLTNALALGLFVRFIWEKPAEPWLLLGLVLLGVGLFARYARRFKRGEPRDYMVLSVPVFFLLYFLIWLFLAGTYRDLPGMLVVAPLVGLASLVAYSWPYRGKPAVP